MKPLRLEMRHLLGIHEAHLDFEPGVVAVVGANGAGKSSILDGLVIALFGEPSPARVVRKSELVRLGSDAGEVALEFESDGTSYRITRRFRNSRPQEATLSRGNGDVWEPLASTVTGVNRIVAGLVSPWTGNAGEEELGRLREAFLHSVFIPQGMVTRLIDARPADRWSVLSAVLGLEQEEGLRERARVLLEIAQDEQGRAEGALEVLRDRLEGLPAEDELKKDEGETDLLLADLHRRRQAFERILELRDKIDEGRVRLERARLDLREREARFGRLSERYRLGEAWQGLSALREKAHAYGVVCRESFEKSRHLTGVEERTGIALKELEDMRASFAQIRSEVRKLAPLADLARPANDFLEAREALAGLEKRCEECRELLVAREREKDLLEKELAVAERRSLEEELEQVRRDHIGAGQELASLMARIVETLVGWLRALADDSGVVRLNHFSGERALELARNFRDSDLQRLVDREARVRQRCQSLLERGKELRRTQNKMHPVEAICPSASPGELGKRIEELERQIARLRGRLESLEAERSRGLAHRGELARRLPRVDEAFFEEVRLAAGRREEMTHRLDSLQESGEKLAVGYERLREQRETLRSEVGRLDERRAHALKDLRGERKSWRRLRDSRDWTSGELRRALALGLPAMEESELDVARGNLEAARIECDHAEKDLQALTRNLPEEPPVREVLEKSLESCDAARMEAIERKSVLRQKLRVRGELTVKVMDVRRKVEGLRPAVDAARRMARLTDGKGFIRFVSDHLLETLLAGVNERLTDRGWILRARQGVFEVVQDGRTRPASGLSGGERAFLALLFLRQLSLRTGFHKILFIDEGLAMLDDDHLEEVVDLLGTIGNEAFVAVITHDPEVAACFPRRWQVDQGRVVVQQED